MAPHVFLRSLYGYGRVGDFAPGLESLGHLSAVLIGWAEMTMRAENHVLSE
jgi:hypothetical protein